MLAAGIAHAAIPAGERAVLDDLYASTNGDGWTTNTGWQGAAGSECGWYGITCATGEDLDHVVAINLIENHLLGSLPALAGLTRLQYFEASINQLTGAIPALNTLSELRAFDAFANLLDGNIPELGGLTNLLDLDVSINQLQGQIPALTGLDALAYFDVADNRLSGPIPALAGLTRLRSFHVGGNQLSGSAPVPPSPNNLMPGMSGLCTYLQPEVANRLAPIPDAAWDAATGDAPWYVHCDIKTIFEFGFE
jgi:hypothetical protein